MASLDTTSLPAKLIISNDTDAAIQLPLYPDNEVFTLNPDEEVIYEVSTSREYLYYYTTCKALGLSLAEATESESTGGNG